VDFLAAEMQGFTGLFEACAPVVSMQKGAGSDPHSFACETESAMSFRRPCKIQSSASSSGVAKLSCERGSGMKAIAIFMAIPSRLRLSSAAESRVIFWNLLFVIVLSSAVLLTYLKKIIFDF
jgi:hypothetical protein